MRFRYRMIALILALTLALPLSACGAGTGNDDTAADVSSSAAETEANTVEEETAPEAEPEAEPEPVEEEEELEENPEVRDTDGGLITSGSAEITFGRETVTVNAAYLIDGVDVEITSGMYTSASGDGDETVFLVVNGGSLTITGTESRHVLVTKTGSGASGGQVSDDYNFYGINSGIVVAGEGSSAVIRYADISTDANGSNAVVATADAAAEVYGSVIVTTGEAGSRGLHATYGGVIDADSTSITTSGRSCAALATDRGGGTVNASNMTLETNGAGSPLVYSTGEINVYSSTGSANGAQSVVVEGGSSAYVEECDFTCSGGGNRTGASESDGSGHVIDAGGIFIYQSFSGDAESGTDYFTAVNSTFTVTTAGVPMFFITNITAVIMLEGCTLNSASDSDRTFVAEETDQWGSVGSNGGVAEVVLTNQDTTGYTAFVGESSSALTFTAMDSSSTDIDVETGTW